MLIRMIVNKLREIVADIRDTAEQLHERIHDEAARIGDKIDKRRAEQIWKRIDELAVASGQPLKPRTSIVDLLKALGLDSSFEARKELWTDAGCMGEYKGTAEQNDMLHAAVLDKLAHDGFPRPE